MVRNENHIFFSFFPIVSSSKRFAFVFGIILHVHTYYERIWSLLNDGSIGIYHIYSSQDEKVACKTRNFYNS